LLEFCGVITGISLFQKMWGYLNRQLLSIGLGVLLRAQFIVNAGFGGALWRGYEILSA